MYSLLIYLLRCQANDVAHFVSHHSADIEALAEQVCLQCIVDRLGSICTYNHYVR